MRLTTLIILTILCYSCDSRETERSFIYKDGKRIGPEAFIQTKGGVLDGYFILYYPNGKIKVKLYYENDRLMKIIKVYNEKKGNLKFGKLVNGNGRVIEFDEDGEPREIGNFKDGYKHGKWYILNYKGDTSQVYMYENGVLEKTHESLFYSSAPNNTYR